MDKVRENCCPPGAYVLGGTNDGGINSPEVRGHVADSSTEGGQEEGRRGRRGLTHGPSSAGPPGSG